MNDNSKVTMNRGDIFKIRVIDSGEANDICVVALKDLHLDTLEEQMEEFSNSLVDSYTICENGMCSHKYQRFETDYVLCPYCGKKLELKWVTPSIWSFLEQSESVDFITMEIAYGGIMKYYSKFNAD